MNAFLLIVITACIIGVGLIGFGFFNVQAQESLPEIDQNQVEDEISRTIIVHLEDGVSSSDGFK